MEKEKIFTADDEMPDCGRCDHINGPDDFCCNECGAGHGWNGYSRSVPAEKAAEKASYWAEKEKRAKEALAHTKEMQDRYGPQIRKCVSGTKLYEGEEMKGVLNRGQEGRPCIVIGDMDTVSAVMALAGKYGKTAVLNFSSYKKPGGMYLEGSRAQEECLCSESFLYNVLKEKTQDFYIPNTKDLNRALYRDRALYVPGVVFSRSGKEKECDVITCAAPNASACRKYKKAGEEEIDRTFRNRVFFVCAVAEKEKVETLILGAYGCGVFGNDPSKAGRYFLEALPHTHIRNVMFAVPGKDQENYIKIAEQIEKWKRESPSHVPG